MGNCYGCCVTVYEFSKLDFLILPKKIQEQLLLIPIYAYTSVNTPEGVYMVNKPDDMIIKSILEPDVYSIYVTRKALDIIFSITIQWKYVKRGLGCPCYLC